MHGLYDLSGLQEANHVQDIVEIDPDLGVVESKKAFDLCRLHGAGQVTDDCGTVVETDGPVENPVYLRLLVGVMRMIGQTRFPVRTSRGSQAVETAVSLMGIQTGHHPPIPIQGNEITTGIQRYTGFSGELRSGHGLA